MLCWCLAAAALLAGCGSSSPAAPLDAAKVERAIATSILAEHHVQTTVLCPADIPSRAGYRFQCTASLEVGKYTVAASETNSGGHVVYENNAPLVVLDIPAVELAIQRSVDAARHVTVDVVCPREVLQQRGLAFRCSATSGGRETAFAVTEIDGDGHVRYVEHA